MNNTTNVHFILDKSGSMTTVREATISGFNEYLNKLKNDKKSDYNFSLTLFDTEKVKKYTVEPIKKIAELNEDTYIPDGMTALYDAACSTINSVRKKVKKTEKNIVVIMTDGVENSSQEYSEKEFRSIIKGLEGEKNWTFVFLGANQDAWANAGKWGFHKGNVVTYNNTKRGVEAAMDVMASSSSSFSASSSPSTSTFMSAEDKKKIEDTK